MSPRWVIVLAAGLVAFSCGITDKDFYQPDYSPRVRITAAGGGEAYGAELLPLDAAHTWMYQKAISVQTGSAHPGIEYVEMQPIEERQIYTDRAWAIANRRSLHTIESYLKVDDAGLWYYGNHLKTEPRPIAWVPFPARVGMKWEVRAEEGDLYYDMKDEDGNGVYRGEVKAKVTIACPAGVFEALHVVVGPDQLWFVPGLGIVKRTNFTSSAESGVLLLRSFDVPAYNGESDVAVQR